MVPAMSEHVHVRLRLGLGVTEDGALTEETYCRCGATWTKVFVLDEDPGAGAADAG